MIDDQQLEDRIARQVEQEIFDKLGVQLRVDYSKDYGCRVEVSVQYGGRFVATDWVYIDHIPEKE